MLLFFYLVTCSRTFYRHIVQRPSSLWLQQKFAFHTRQSALLIQRGAHKTPVAVHLHQFEYLTPNRDQTRISNQHHLFHQYDRRRKLLFKANLSLSVAEHTGCRLLQVLLLGLGRVIDVDRVGGAVRQVAVVDGSSFCLELKTKVSSDGPSF